MTDRIPQQTLDAASRAFRFQVLAELNRAFAQSGLTLEIVASRLGVSTRYVLHRLNGRQKLTLCDIGELAFAIDGSVIEFTIEPRDVE